MYGHTVCGWLLSRRTEACRSPKHLNVLNELVTNLRHAVIERHSAAALSVDVVVPEYMCDKDVRLAACSQGFYGLSNRPISAAHVLVSDISVEVSTMMAGPFEHPDNEIDRRFITKVTSKNQDEGEASKA